jgi:hypothetical protein
MQELAAEKARNLADMMLEAVETQQEKDQKAWLIAQGRLGGKLIRSRAGGGGGSRARNIRVPVREDWIRFKGEVDSEAYEQMLKKTPPEYRDLVKQYFEELSPLLASPLKMEGLFNE